MHSILLVEDSRSLLVASEKALVRAGFNVMSASDGEEALRMACATAPDLVLLDMLLPKLGGPDVLHALRSSAVTVLVPIVVLSSLPQSNEGKLLKAAATAYFEKSKVELDQNAESLIQIVKRILLHVTQKRVLVQD